jgi:hypothetical protein
VRHVKNGRPPGGSQRSLCRVCGHRATPAPTPQGSPQPLREPAVRLSADGRTLRRSARHRGVVPQTVAPWVAAHADALPDQPPQPAAGETAARAALYTYGGAKTTPAPS